MPKLDLTASELNALWQAISYALTSPYLSPSTESNLKSARHKIMQNQLTNQ